jgi:tetratricopeptide (TPR) repeat protein
MPDISDLMKAGNDLAGKKEWAEALERYRAASVLEPNNAEAHFLAGCCHFKMNHGPGAREEWHRALAIDPHYEKAQLWVKRVIGLSTPTPLAEN